MSSNATARQQRTRQNILTAAERVFLKNGFLGTSMDQVAETAGMSKQTVYAHFKSKEALFREVVISMTGTAAHALHEDTEAAPDGRPVEDVLMEAAINQLNVVLTPRLMQLRRMVIGEIERFPDLGVALFDNGPRKSIERFARLFAHYNDAGRLDVPDPANAAAYFNWILMGAPTNAAMLLGNAALPGTRQRREHAQESVRIFLSAYGPEAMRGS
ncbi:TetR/AcrR family transcriptional regulator [uncultured Nitratireductor sp.]|uniref:TetR/AcrR family transcriptional regulator n=1 Tax=uncultured Nitratireductor sp. TaxID=520953 RepID=UPI0025E29311|nr:TetR/AcrR family transcriptional regulator [uncultured Nitratireductor sp.]